MFMRMKKIIIAFAAALAVLSACEKTPALPVVQFDKANYILDSDTPLTVKVVSDKAFTADVKFTVGGTAVKGEDYTMSVENSVSFAEAYTAEIVITPLNNLEEKSIVLELAGNAAEFTLGTNVKSTIGVTPKEKVACSFANQKMHLTESITVSAKLIGAQSGDKFTALGELKIPFTVEGTAVEGADYDIVGGEHFLVANIGDAVAKVKINTKLSQLPEVPPTLTLKLGTTDRFSIGVNGTVSVEFGNKFAETDFMGKWAYSSYPLHDDEEADKGTFDMLIEDAGDTWETNIPWKNSSSDVIEFKTEDGVNKLAVSGTGDIFDFLTDAEVTGIESHPYTWYYYYPERPWDNSVEIHLSKVNYDFAEKSTDYKAGTIILNLSEDGKTLDLVIPATSYDPVNGDYFKGVRSAYEGVVWTMYIEYGYWDCYYQFTKVSE